MKKGDYDSNIKGFTIIEVALVLAIAGLIFLMVFIALPGLRASQRDAERREDVTMFLENVKKYQTNNRGTLPGSSETDKLDNQGSITVNGPVNNSDNVKDTFWAGFYQKYLGNNFVDPDGENYNLLITACGSQVAENDCVEDSRNKLNDLYEASFPNNYKMYVVTQASCSGDRAVGTNNPRKLAVLYKLEGAGIYCANT